MAIISTYLTTTSDTMVFEAVGQQVVTTVYLCNTSGSTVTANLYLVNGTDSSIFVGPENQIYSNLELQSGNTYVMSTEKLILDDLNQIRVSANIGNAVTVTVSTYKI